MGLRTAQLIVNRGAEAFLTYYCGPFCFETLSMVDCQVVTGIKGSVREAIEAFQQGKLKYAKGPNIDARVTREERARKDIQREKGPVPSKSGWENEKGI